MNQQYEVYGVGHAVVDTQYSVPPGVLADLGIDKGVMTLIDATRRQRVLSGLGAAPGRSASGGSAANTMITLARFGGRAYFACQVGDDEWGTFYRRDLEEVGVASSPAAHRPGPTGQCLVLVTPDADRTMNTFLGVSSGMGPDQIEAGIIGASQWIYLEGYLLSSELGLAACLQAQAEARERGVSISLTLSDPTIVEIFRGHFEQVIEAGVDLLFCNEDEAIALTRRGDRQELTTSLAAIAPAACITCGSEGALALTGGSVEAVPGHRVKAVDTTGAGDAFAGGTLYGLTHGHSLATAAGLGCYAAALVVSSYGPRLEVDLSDTVGGILAGELPPITAPDL